MCLQGGVFDKAGGAGGGGAGGGGAGRGGCGAGSDGGSGGGACGGDGGGDGGAGGAGAGGGQLATFQMFLQGGVFDNAESSSILRSAPLLKNPVMLIKCKSLRDRFVARLPLQPLSDTS